MNTSFKTIALFGVAILLSVAPAVAGGQTHVMPSFYGKASTTYDIKIVPTAGAPFTVQVVDKDSGKPVANATVTMQHKHWLGIKGVPQFQYIQLPLTPDGHGNYVCDNGPLFAGEPVVIRATTPGDPAASWLITATND